eukprot:jgi/Chlat1/8748/Chrsp9S08569
MECLSGELLAQVLARVEDGRDLARCAHVCRAWRNAAQEDDLWKRLFENCKSSPACRTDVYLRCNQNRSKEILGKGPGTKTKETKKSMTDFNHDFKDCDCIYERLDFNIHAIRRKHGMTVMACVLNHLCKEPYDGDLVIFKPTVMRSEEDPTQTSKVLVGEQKPIILDGVTVFITVHFVVTEEDKMDKVADAEDLNIHGFGPRAPSHKYVQKVFVRARAFPNRGQYMGDYSQLYATPAVSNALGPSELCRLLGMDNVSWHYA